MPYKYCNCYINRNIKRNVQNYMPSCWRLIEAN